MKNNTFNPIYRNIVLDGIGKDMGSRIFINGFEVVDWFSTTINNLMQYCFNDRANKVDVFYLSDHWLDANFENKNLDLENHSLEQQEIANNIARNLLSENWWGRFEIQEIVYANKAFKYFPEKFPEDYEVKLIKQFEKTMQHNIEYFQTKTDEYYSKQRVYSNYEVSQYTKLHFDNIQINDLSISLATNPMDKGLGLGSFAHFEKTDSVFNRFDRHILMFGDKSSFLFTEGLEIPYYKEPYKDEIAIDTKFKDGLLPEFINIQNQPQAAQNLLNNNEKINQYIFNNYQDDNLSENFSAKSRKDIREALYSNFNFKTFSRLQAHFYFPKCESWFFLHSEKLTEIFQDEKIIETSLKEHYQYLHKLFKQKDLENLMQEFQEYIIYKNNACFQQEPFCQGDLEWEYIKFFVSLPSFKMLEIDWNFYQLQIDYQNQKFAFMKDKTSLLNSPLLFEINILEMLTTNAEFLTILNNKRLLKRKTNSFFYNPFMQMITYQRERLAEILKDKQFETFILPFPSYQFIYQEHKWKLALLGDVHHCFWM